MTMIEDADISVLHFCIFDQVALAGARLAIGGVHSVQGAWQLAAVNCAVCSFSRLISAASFATS